MYRIAPLFLIGLLFCTTIAYAAETPTGTDQEVPTVNYAEAVSQLQKTEKETRSVLKKYASGEPLLRLRTAAAGGDADAQVLLSFVCRLDLRNGSYARGQDVPEAIRWLKAAAAQGHEDAKQELKIECRTCDQKASHDLENLALCLARLADEQNDLAVPEVERYNFLDKNGIKVIKYLRGPYYGWGGGSPLCGTRFRVVGHEVWACSPIPTLVEGNPEKAKIFRARLYDGKVEPETCGPCEGVEMSSRWPCYLDTMMRCLIDPDPNINTWSAIREPCPMNCNKINRAMRKMSDATKAPHDYAEAARKGDAEAQFKLGTIYAEPETSREELVEAVKWFGKAADQGHEGAKAELAKAKAALAEMERK